MKRVIIIVAISLGLVFSEPLWVKDSDVLGAFNSVFVVDNAGAWAVGRNYSVYKRTGITHSNQWSPIVIQGANACDFNDICVIGSNVWVVGENRYLHNGVIYKSTNNGVSWTDQTGNIEPPLTLATPFVKVQMVEVSGQHYGYVSCGTGTVLKTVDGGASWSRCKSPWNNSHNDSLSVQYNGLWVDPDPQHPDHLRVSGDAFGIVAESEDGGATWTANVLPEAFNHTYSFPQQTYQPFGTKLANFDLCFPSQNTGYLGLSNGRVGYTANGGETWTTWVWDDESVWFHDIADLQSTAIFGAGSYHAINQQTTQEHNFHDESYALTAIAQPLNSIGFSAGGYGYAVGHSLVGSYYDAILQRYDPCQTFIRVITPNENANRIEIHWYTTGEENAAYWGVQVREKDDIVYNGNNKLVTAGNTEDYWYFYDLTDAKSKTFYVTFKLYTAEYATPWYPFQIYGPYEVEAEWIQAAPPLAMPEVSCSDILNDNGGAIHVQWSPVTNADGYLVGRAEDPSGPYCYFYTPINGTNWDDISGLITGKHYYYQVIAYNNNLPPNQQYQNSAPGTANGMPIDNLHTPSITAISGTYNDVTQTIEIVWSMSNTTNKDIAAYWVCPETEQRYSLAHSSPINRTIYHWPLPGTPPPVEWATVAVAAMDYNDSISDWVTYDVPTASHLVVGNEPCASGLNNSRKLLYSLSDQLLKAVFTDKDTVFYRTSSDEGSTWSTPQALCPGIYPGLVNDASNERYLVCVQRTPNPNDYNPIQEQEYYQPGSYTWKILYKKTSSGTWDSQITILDSVVQTDNGGSIVFSAPAIAITSDDTVHVTVAHTIYEQYMGAWRWKWQLLYTNFHKNKPQVLQWFTIYEITQSASAPPPGACPLHPSDPTMVSDAYNNINVGFGISSQTKYCYRKDRVWQTVQSLTGTGMHGQPCLGINGDEITLVWAGNPIPGQGSQILCRRRFVPNGRWGNTERIDQGENLSVFPVTLNNKVLWCEQIDGDNWDIYYSYLEGSTWSTPENLTNDSPRSLLPQIAYNDRYDRVYYIFTARDTIPYWVLFKKKDTVRGAFYGYSLGAEEVSASTVERDTFVDYGGAAYKHMDRAAGQLSYGVTGLNPNHDYEFAWDWYHELNNPIHLKLKINNELEHTLNIPPRHHISPRIPIPANLYANGTLSISINPQGNTSALLSGFAIFDVTIPESGPQAGHEYEANAKPYLKLAPNPFSGQLQITYDLGPKTKNGTLFIYDACGRRVKSFTLCNSSITPHNSIIWNRTDDSGRSVSSGVYFIRLQTDDYAKVEKAILLK